MKINRKEKIKVVNEWLTTHHLRILQDTSGMFMRRFSNEQGPTRLALFDYKIVTLAQDRPQRKMNLKFHTGLISMQGVHGIELRCDYKHVDEHYAVKLLRLPIQFAQTFHLPSISTRTFEEHHPHLQEAFLTHGFEKKGGLYERSIHPSTYIWKD